MYNQTILDAVFAMDAYDHSPGNGDWSVDFVKNFSKLVSGSLGDYKIAMVSSPKQNDSNNFFAIAYKSADGSTILSYRGTTNLLWDAYNGYGVGAGSPYGPDAQNAIQFYQDVLGRNNSTAWRSSNVTVTGHSLGGGLAGFVGAVYGLKGDLFDNMTFNNAAEAAYRISNDVTDPNATAPAPQIRNLAQSHSRIPARPPFTCPPHKQPAIHRHSLR